MNRKSWMTLLGTLCMVLCSVSCAEKYVCYDGPEYIMFADTVQVLGVQDNDSLFKIPVVATQVADKDRTLAVEIVDQKSSAIEGLHYKLASNTIVIKAGERTTNVLVQGFTDKLKVEDSLKFVLRLVTEKEYEWNLYHGNEIEVQLKKVCPFDIHAFTGYAVLTSSYIYNYMHQDLRLIRTELDPKEENTVILKNCFYDGYDLRVHFTTDDPMNPLIEMKEQKMVSTGEAFGTILGDGMFMAYQPTAYQSYYSTCEKFLLQYMTVWCPGLPVGKDLLGTFVNVVEWISDDEAEKLMREGY